MNNVFTRKFSKGGDIGIDICFTISLITTIKLLWTVLNSVILLFWLYDAFGLRLKLMVPPKKENSVMVYSEQHWTPFPTIVWTRNRFERFEMTLGLVMIRIIFWVNYSNNYPSAKKNLFLYINCLYMYV